MAGLVRGQGETSSESLLCCSLLPLPPALSLYPRLMTIAKVLRVSLLSLQAQLQLPLSASRIRSKTSERPPAGEEKRGGRRSVVRVLPSTGHPPLGPCLCRVLSHSEPALALRQGRDSLCGGVSPVELTSACAGYFE